MKKNNDIVIEGDVPPVVSDEGICPICAGVGMVVHTDEKGIGYARPCICIRDEIAKDPYKVAAIPDRFRHCTLKSFAVVNDNLKRIRGRTIKFTQIYPNVAMGILFMGEPGLGKTHLAIGILAELIETKGVNCLFVDFADLLIEIRGAIGRSDDYLDNLLRPISEVDVLVIDDLGAMKQTDWAMDMLTHVINGRYKSGKILIATTNFPDTGGSIKGHTLEERIGKPLRSRLYEMCKTYILKGDDFRKTNKKDRNILKDPTLDE